MSPPSINTQLPLVKPSIATGRLLIDGGDIIVHLFDVETRTLYDLDNLWASQISPKDSIV